MTQKYQSFAEYYPFYLSQHKNLTCRRLHFIGSLLILFFLFYILITGYWKFSWLLPLLGYGFAWIGHFFFEKNKPTTFQYPFYSLLGDWVMFKDILIRKISF